MNGWLRRYLPKTTTIDHVAQKELDLLADKMNLCPRKCLGFKMPKDCLYSSIKMIVVLGASSDPLVRRHIDQENYLIKSVGCDVTKLAITA